MMRRSPSPALVCRGASAGASGPATPQRATLTTKTKLMTRAFVNLIWLPGLACAGCLGAISPTMTCCRRATERHPAIDQKLRIAFKRKYRGSLFWVGPTSEPYVVVVGEK